MADESGTTQMTETQATFDTETGEAVDLDLDQQHLVETPWRVGRWLRVVVHAQRDARAGLRDRPIGVMLTPTLARQVVDQQNALHAAAPWGADDSPEPDPEI